MTICKKHPSEPGIGVCAACLRDRLLSLQSCVTQRPCPLSSVQQDHGSRPLVFGACPSPLQGKKAGFSVLSTLFGTPGGGPSPSGERRFRGHDDHPSSAPQRLDMAAPVPPSFSSWLAALFAVRCKRNKRPGGTVPASDTREACSVASSADTSGTENKADPPPAPLQRPICRFQNFRGMSPGSEQEEEEQQQQQKHQHVEGEENRGAGSSPSSSSTPSGDHPGLPCPTPARKLRRQNPAVVNTGFVTFFSPLVRARPPHHHHRSLVVARDSGGAAYGEHHNPVFRLRRHGQNQQHLHQHHRLWHGGGGGGGVRLCPSRSRKLVDMGRFR